MAERIPVVENILSANQRLANENRFRLDSAGIFGLNIMASPGAGKTSLIENTIRRLAGQIRILVIDGDIATSIDADRAAAAGATAIQVNTGGECHMDAVMLNNALDQADLSKIDFLIVENVGNLICPASFPLGTHKSILIASIPEGDDKPYKYPVMYRGVNALVVNKVDLKPYVPFKMDYFLRGVDALNPGLVSFQVSCVSGEGMDGWIGWIQDEIDAYKHG